MRYKVGDVVKLRDDLDIGEEYGAVDFLYSMKTLKNKALRIDSIDTDDDECVVYEIDGWWISEEMIEGLWEECKEKQDKIKLIDVLNMIANGELKEGTKVKYGGVEYTYKKFDSQDNDSTDLISDSSCSIFEDYFLTSLQDEVELIEPPCVGVDKTIEPTKIEEIEGKIEVLGAVDLAESWMVHYIRENRNKLNEVIRKINKE